MNSRKLIGYLCAVVLELIFTSALVVSVTSVTTAVFKWPISEPDVVEQMRFMWGLFGGFFLMALLAVGATWGLQGDTA